MSKTSNKWIVLVSVILISFTILGVYIMVKDSNEKNYVNSQHSAIEETIKKNYVGIKSVTFTGYKKVPTGFFINGYVNNDKDMDFSADIIGNGDYDKKAGAMSASEKLDNLSKYYDKNKGKH